MSNATLRINPLLTASNMMNEAEVQAETQELSANVDEACQRSADNALRQLYEASHHNVYRLIVRMIGLRDASGVIQQVFLQVFRRIGQFSGRADIGTWIYRVAINEALQHLRRS